MVKVNDPSHAKRGRDHTLGRQYLIDPLIQQKHGPVPWTDKSDNHNTRDNNKR